jgi:hypothetical protein
VAVSWKIFIKNPFLKISYFEAFKEDFLSNWHMCGAGGRAGVHGHGGWHGGL